MNRENNILSLVLPIMKTALAVIFFTFVMIFLLALVIFKFHINDSVINNCIIAIYFLANFIGGMIIGKVKKEKKFLWGFITGLTYFIILSIASFIALQSFYSSPASALFAFVSCILGGMAGGMTRGMMA